MLVVPRIDSRSITPVTKRPRSRLWSSTISKPSTIEGAVAYWIAFIKNSAISMSCDLLKASSSALAAALGSAGMVI